MRATSFLFLSLALAGSAAAETPAPDRGRDPFRADPRLLGTVTVRVSRMPVGDLLERLSATTGVRLAAEGEDVADQKVDLFTHGDEVSAVELLTAIADLLNTHCPPRGFRWDASGRAESRRYTLVRDVASRRWEARQWSLAAERMAGVLRARFTPLAREPFRPDARGVAELPTMRKVPVTLSEEQIARLCEDRFVIIRRPECTPEQRRLLDLLVGELVAETTRRDPDTVQTALERNGSLATPPDATIEVLVRGEPPRYTVEVGVSGPRPLGQLGHVGMAVDTAALAAGSAGPKSAAPPDAPEPVFALPPRTRYRMGDVLADLAARGRVSLIADDYTQDWSAIGRLAGARSLSAWLALIREEYGFDAFRDGKFVRLRNRVWWLDRKREIPLRLLTRWRGLLQGTNADRFRMLVEIARLAPHSLHPRVISDRLKLLEESPEMAWSVHQDGPRSMLHLTHVVAKRQIELLLYDRLSPTRQQAVLGSGLRVRWPDLPEGIRQAFLRALPRPEDAPLLWDTTLFMRYSGDLLQLNREHPSPSLREPAELIIRPQPADDLSRLLGTEIPELEVEAIGGKTTTLRPRGPALLYVTPAWPRPLVTDEESFADLKAVAGITGPNIHLLATGATLSELRDWWKARGLETPPRGLSPSSAERLGSRHLPVAILLDRDGRVVWVKEGYAPGDEAEWRRRLSAVGG